MKNQLFLITITLSCVAFSCKKNNDDRPFQQASAQNEKVLNAIAGKSYLWTAYYSMDANNNTEDLSNQVACALKDTIYYSQAIDVSRVGGSTSGEITNLTGKQYTYCNINSCWVNNTYNARLNPNKFTNFYMSNGTFSMPFPINQLKLISYPPEGVRMVNVGGDNLVQGALLFKDVDASNKLKLYYNGIDNKTYYIELSRL